MTILIGIMAALCYASLMTEGVQGFDGTDPRDCVINLGDSFDDMKNCLKICHEYETCAQKYREVCRDTPADIPQCWKTYFASLDMTIQKLYKIAGKYYGVTIGTIDAKELNVALCYSIGDSEAQSEAKKECFMQCYLDATCHEEWRKFCIKSETRKDCFRNYRSIVRQTYKVVVERLNSAQS